MCTKCQDILKGFQLIHSVADCPLVQTSYCGACASRGHSTSECPDPQIWKHREPEYLEQLLPVSIMTQYNITTKTPLPTRQWTRMQQPIMEVKDDDVHVRAILRNHDKQISGRDKENRVRLQKLADELGQKLVFVTVENGTTPAKKTKANKKAKAQQTTTA